MHIPWVTSFDEQETIRFARFLAQNMIHVNFFKYATDSLHHLLNVDYDVIVINPYLQPGQDYEYSELARDIRFTNGYLDFSSVGVGLMLALKESKIKSPIIVADSSELYVPGVEQECLETLCSARDEYVFLRSIEPREFYYVVRELSRRTRHF